MQAHAFVIEAESEAGIELALAHTERELGMHAKGNPDVLVLRYGLFSVEDARRVAELSSESPFSGEQRAVIIAAGRAYREAQNALLKLFEEPPRGVTLFLILPTLGGLLPTLRSRVAVLHGERKGDASPVAHEFLAGGADRRSSIIKKLTSGKDDEDRRENRDEALALVNGIEQTAYARFGREHDSRTASLLTDLAVLRGYLNDRSAPVKLILEHLALVTPRGLGGKE